MSDKGLKKSTKEAIKKFNESRAKKFFKTLPEALEEEVKKTLSEEIGEPNELYDVRELYNNCLTLLEGNESLPVKCYCSQLHLMLVQNDYEPIFENRSVEGELIKARMPGELTYDLLDLTINEYKLNNDKEPFKQVLKQIINYQFTRKEVINVLNAELKEGFNNPPELIIKTYTHKGFKHYCFKLENDSLVMNDYLINHK